MRRLTRHPCLLPYVQLADRSQLPKRPGVYYAINPWKPWEVLYVGMSGNMRQRWLGDRHHQLNALLDIGSVRLHYRVLRSELTSLNLFAEIEETVTDLFWAIVIGATVTTIGLGMVETAKGQASAKQALERVK